MATYLVQIDFERLADRLMRDSAPNQPPVGDLAGWLKAEGFSAVPGGWICENHPASVLEHTEYALLDRCS